MQTTTRGRMSISALMVISSAFITFGWVDSSDADVIYSRLFSSNEAIIAKKTLEKSGYDKIKHYAQVTSDAVCVIAHTKKGGVHLSFLYLSGCKPNVIMDYTPKQVDSFTATGFAIHGSHLVLLYTMGNHSVKADERITHVDILQVGKEGLYRLLAHEMVAQTDIAWDNSSAANKPYAYLAVDNSRVGPGDIKPAFKSAASIFFNDVNGDGLTDILVWQRTYRSPAIDEPDSFGFVLEDQQLSALYFEPEKDTYSKLTSLAGSEQLHLRNLLRIPAVQFGNRSESYY